MIVNKSLFTESYTVSIGIEEIIVSEFPQMVIRTAAKMIAEKFVEDNYAEIASSIDAKAVSNMAIAEAGAAINETLHKKLPDKIIEIERNTNKVFKQGLFGGIKRID